MGHGKNEINMSYNTRLTGHAYVCEMGKTSQELINNGGQLAKISQHQVNKRSMRQQVKSKPNNTSQSKSCENHGKTDHTLKLNDRRDHCLAFDKTCKKCKIQGHYTNMCWGGPRTTRDKSKNKDSNGKVNEVKEPTTPPDTAAQDSAELGTLLGRWMLLNGLQDTSNSGVFYEVTDEFSSALRRPHFAKSAEASLAALSQKDIKKLRHHIMDNFGNWQPSHVQPHGHLQLKVKVSDSAIKQFNLPRNHNSTSVSVSALADTGNRCAWPTGKSPKTWVLREQTCWYQH